MLTWANPKLESLEKQALGPMLGTEPIELGLGGREEQFLEGIRRDSVYQKLFREAFGRADTAVTLEKVTSALAAFERSIVSLRSPYDRYRWGGAADAISPSARRGEIVFSSSEKGGCFQCHGGWNFSAVKLATSNDLDQPGGREGIFFNTGVSDYPEPNRGLFEHTRQAGDEGRFRAPTLRNIAVTAPYMHDGSMATLEDVIAHYDAGGRHPYANQSPLVHPLHLSATEKQDLIEFLKSLTDEELLHDPRWSDPWPAASPHEH